MSWAFDHLRDKSIKGFRLLTLAWSDGNTLVPSDLALLAATKEDKRINAINENISKRSAGCQRRSEALDQAINRLVAFVVERLRQRCEFGEKLLGQFIDDLMNVAAALFLQPQIAKSES